MGKRISHNTRLVNAINLDTRLKANHKAVMHALVSYRNNRTGRCSPSVKGIAERAGMSERQVYTVLKELRSGGMIAYNGIKNVNTWYTIYPPRGFSTENISDEPIESEKRVDYSKWSQDTIDAVMAVLNYRYNPKDFYHV